MNYCSCIYKISIGSALILFQFINGYTQDQKLADSLIEEYKMGAYQADDLMVLRKIAQNEQNPDRKLHYTQKLIERAEKDSVFEFLISGYLEKGNALQLKGEYANALDSYFKSLDFANRVSNDVGRGLLMVSIADTYSMIGNAGNAILYYRKGITIQRKTNDSIKLATALLNAGDEYFYSGNLDSALIYARESEIIFEKVNYPIGQAYGLGNIGMIYAEQEKDNLAEDNINEAILILEKLEDYYPISVYLTYMADIYLRKDDLTTAINYAQRSLNLATQYGLKEQISEANLKLSELYEAKGEAATSYTYYKDHISYRDSVKNIEAVQQMADQRTEFEVSQKQVEVDLLNEQKRTQRIIAIATAIALALIGVLAIGLYRRNTFIKKTNEIIAAEKDRSENLLLNILPEETAQELKEHGKVKAQKFESVTVLFTDFKGFTKFSENLAPEELVEQVDFYFSKFDAIMENHGLEKIKTIGDAYMCAAGLPFPIEDHASRMTRAAIDIVRFVQESKEDPDNNQAHLDIRVGIHSGPVVAGVVGTKKFSYDIWGDTVNVASRMESNSEPGRINVSENTYQLIKEEFDCSFRGEIEAKNRGSLKMYFVEEGKVNG
ncbi:MAG: adenylate/guanylate cyclase domain-containing protein [Flavobacteriaceae bacterium]